MCAPHSPLARPSVKVSIIVPVYNKAPYIARCLRSISSQTYEDFELLIVDDGSTDDSVQEVRRHDDPRLRLIQQPNRGPGAARNTGMAAARGALCAFLDADDEWLPHYLEDSVAFLDRHTAVAAVTSGYIECPSGVSTEPMWRRRGIADGILRLSPQHTAPELVAFLAYMSCWSTVVRRQVALSWGGFYDRDRCLYAEDAFLWLKLLLNEPVGFIMHPGVKYHREASELSVGRASVRPVEPFLVHPDLMRAACPPPLEELLEGFLATRAFKTTCVLGFWGEWRAALALFQRFAKPKHWNQPFFAPALALANPVGASFARAFRPIL
jgi:glycosyltransferase involved in cell wall biosynthesis